MQLDDLRKSPKQMTTDQIRENILEVRKLRRNYNRAGAKAQDKKKKEEPAISIDELENLLEDL